MPFVHELFLADGINGLNGLVSFSKSAHLFSDMILYFPDNF